MNKNTNYLMLLIDLVLDISDEVNKGSSSYKKDLESLQLLLKTGKTNKEIVEGVNSVLIKEIESCPSEYSQMVIEINSNQEGFTEFVSKSKSLIQEAKDKKIKDDSRDSLKLKGQLKDLIKNATDDLFFENKIIRISCPEPILSSNIVDEYVENYAGQSRPNKQKIYFSPQVIKDYYQYLEFKISKKINEDENLLMKNVKSVIIDLTKNIIENIDSTDIDLLESRVLYPLNASFAWLDPRNDSDLIKEELQEFKDEIRKKVIKLAERANSETFPSLLEERINSSREKYQETILEISDILSKLEVKRRDLVNEIKAEGLDDYGNFVHLGEEEELSYNEALLIKDKISSYGHAIVFKSFVKKRQEKGKIIREQLGNGKDSSYKGVKDQIESLEGIPLDQLDDVVNYFIFSVKLFAEELENTILGDLETSFIDIRSRVNPICSIYEKKLLDLRNKEKEIEKNERQEKINSLLGSMTHYMLPQVVADKIINEFGLSTDEDVSIFLKSHSDESFCIAISNKLSLMNIEELLDTTDSTDIMAILAKDITHFRTEEVKNYVGSVKDVVKDLISNQDFLSLLAISSNIIAPGLGMGFSFLVGVMEAKSRTKEQEAQFMALVRENMNRAVHQIGSAMIKNKFQSLLKQKANE